MGVFGIVLLVLFSIVSLLLIFMVVIQDQEGEGLGGLFAGAGNAAFGSRSTSVVVRFTYILGALFFIIAFSLALINRTPSADMGSFQPTEANASSDWIDAPSATATPSETVPAATETAPAASN